MSEKEARFACFCWLVGCHYVIVKVLMKHQRKKRWVMLFQFKQHYFYCNFAVIYLYFAVISTKFECPTIQRSERPPMLVWMSWQSFVGSKSVWFYDRKLRITWRSDGREVQVSKSSKWFKDQNSTFNHSNRMMWNTGVSWSHGQNIPHLLEWQLFNDYRGYSGRCFMKSKDALYRTTDCFQASQHLTITGSVPLVVIPCRICMWWSQFGDQNLGSCFPNEMILRPHSISHWFSGCNNQTYVNLQRLSPAFPRSFLDSYF